MAFRHKNDVVSTIKFASLSQIEEITNNLALSGELSGSTSSLDSCVGEDGTPPQKQKTGAKAKWQGAAKKALLAWVKRKTKK